MSDEARRLPAYEIFALPAEFGGRLPRDMTPRQAQRYFTWFIDNIPNRLTGLQAVVGLNLDLSGESLAPLGEWFCSVIVGRRRTLDEIRSEMARWSKRSRELGLPVDELTLTEESFSICIDVGIYLGECYRRHLPDARWALCTKPRNDISYHQPRIEGLEPHPIDPIRVTVSNGYLVAQGQGHSGMFVEGYQWLAARNRTA